MQESTTGSGRACGRVRGFTLIELMVTIAVASVLLAIAVPSFNQMVVSGRLVSQTNEMIAGMTLARSEAIKRNASVIFCRADNGAATSCSAAAGNWSNWIVLGGGNVIRRGAVNTFGGTLVVQSTLSTDRVVYGPDGLARTGSAMVSGHTITLCSTRRADNNMRRVVMGAGSRMSTQLGTC